MFCCQQRILFNRLFRCQDLTQQTCTKTRIIYEKILAYVHTIVLGFLSDHRDEQILGRIQT